MQKRQLFSNSFTRPAVALAVRQHQRSWEAIGGATRCVLPTTPQSGSLLVPFAAPSQRAQFPGRPPVSSR
jgi:hypothetical protein